MWRKEEISKQNDFENDFPLLQDFFVDVILYENRILQKIAPGIHKLVRPQILNFLEDQAKNYVHNFPANESRTKITKCESDAYDSNQL